MPLPIKCVFSSPLIEYLYKTTNSSLSPSIHNNYALFVDIIIIVIFTENTWHCTILSLFVQYALYYTLGGFWEVPRNNYDIIFKN